MKKIHFTYDELHTMCYALISLETTKVKKEKEEFFKSVFDQIPIDWNESRDGRDIELSEEHWNELAYYTAKGQKDWHMITGSYDNPHTTALAKILLRSL